MPKNEESLVCPLCGNTNVNSAGIPFGETHYYQCQSDWTHRGCGYLADRSVFKVDLEKQDSARQLHSI